jgi:hypothetical protein
VTARLSKRFYDRFGDDIANEFVNWFNDVDATYRASLIQLNDTNFVRFDAKLEQRLAEQDSRIEKRFAESDAKWEKRFAESDAKWEKRFAESDVKWEKRFTESDVKLEKRFADIDRRFAESDVKLERGLAGLRSGMLTWMVGLWLTSMVAVTGMFVTLLRLR